MLCHVVAVASRHAGCNSRRVGSGDINQATVKLPTHL